MDLKTIILVTAAAVAMSATSARANDPLPRRMQFGVMVEPAPGGGLKVLGVSPGLTADSAGVLEGDIIVSVDGKATSSAGDLVQHAELRRAGDTLQIEVRRGQTPVRFRASAMPRPRETYADARVEYGAVDLAGGQVRTLFAVPSGWKDGPVLYMLQGHPCASVEALEPADPTKAFVGEMLAAGVAVYRIEKSGVGDSVGGPRCEEGNFDLELAGFEAGWSDLTTGRDIGNDKIFLFGHSMGGVHAPLIAAAHGDAPPRGIVVYGTVLRNFHDYLFDLLRLQSFLMLGEDPVQANKSAEQIRPVLYRLILQGTEPSQLIDDLGVDAKAALEKLGWDGDSAMMGHPVQYWRDLASLDLVSAWRDAHSQVLSLYGEADLTALNDEDAITIAAVVNHYRPGTARYVEVQADHLLSVAPTRAEAIGDATANAPMLGLAPPRPFNPTISRLITDWVTASLALPSAHAVD